MFGDEGAAAGEPERFSTRGGSMDDILASMGYRRLRSWRRLAIRH